MATSPATKSALLSGAAKDDTIVGVTFSINDLLGNDPGGAAKVNLTTQFFFGDSAADQGVLGQAAYLEAHGLTKISDDNGGTYQIGVDGLDFKYFVQIGNKGTWSQAAVDITAPVPEPHLGDNLFTENFDGYAGTTYQQSGSTWQATNLNTASGWTGATAAGSELGSNGYLGVETTTAGHWLDTQNSIGPVNLEHTFNDSTAAASDGVTAVLSFDIARQDFDGFATSEDASFEFRIDGQTVAHIDADQLANAGEMYHFEFDINGYVGAGPGHTLQLIDTTAADLASYNGFSVDSIQINDWVI